MLKHVFFSFPCSIQQPHDNLSCSLTAFWSPDFLFGFVSLMNSVCLSYSTLFPKQNFFFFLSHSNWIYISWCVCPHMISSCSAQFTYLFFWNKLLLPPLFCYWYFSNWSSITNLFLKWSNYCAFKGMVGLISTLSSFCILLSTICYAHSFFHL